MSSSRHVAGANGGDEDGAGDDEDGESSVAFGDRLERRLRRGFDRARVDGDVHGGVDAAIVLRVTPDRRSRRAVALQATSERREKETRSYCRPVSEPGE